MDARAHHVSSYLNSTAPFPFKVRPRRLVLSGRLWLPKTRIASGWSRRLHYTNTVAKTRSFLRAENTFFCLHMITRGIEHFVEYIQDLLFEFSVHSLLVICKIVAWSAFFFSVLFSPTMNPNVRPFGTFETKMADLRNGERSTSTILLKNRELWAVYFWRWTLQRKRREICSSSTVWCKLSPIGGLKMWHKLLENLPGIAEPLLSNSYVLFNSAVSCVAVNVRLR